MFVPTSPYPSLALAGGAATIGDLLRTYYFPIEALKDSKYCIVVVVVVVADPDIIAFTSLLFCFCFR
jgi:hypothetical protein